MRNHENTNKKRTQFQGNRTQCRNMDRNLSHNLGRTVSFADEGYSDNWWNNDEDEKQ